MDGAERTHPSACKASENKGQYDRNSRKHKRRKHSSRCDKSCQSDQGIEMEKNLHISNIILSREMGLHQEPKKKNKKQGLAYDPECLYGSVFFRSFFFQFSASPGQLLRDLFYLRSLGM